MADLVTLSGEDEKMVWLTREELAAIAAGRGVPHSALIRNAENLGYDINDPEELSGIWAAIGNAVAKIATGIPSAIRRRREERRSMQFQAATQSANLNAAAAAERAKTKRTYIMAGAALAGVAALYLFTRK